MSDRDFARVRREIDKAAVAIVRAVETLLARTAALESVAPDGVVENLLLTLLHEHDFAKLLDRMAQPGPVTLQLSNALHDYRDSRFEDR